MSKIFRKTLFTVLTLGMTLLVFEGVARLAETVWPSDPVRPLPAPGAADCMPDCMPGIASLPERPAGLQAGIPMVPHGSRAWALPPNTVMVETNVRTRVNSLGLRGAEVPAQRAEGEIRLMTLGDSSVFGFGVDEEKAFGAVAAQMLSNRWNTAVVPINGGTPGYTSEQALQTLVDVGNQVRPDWVVIACLWSDLFQTDVPIERAGGQQAPFALYRVTTRILAPWLDAPTVGWVEGTTGAPSDGRTARVGIERYARNLDALVARTLALGARPVFMILPAPSDLDPLPVPAFIDSYRQAMVDAARRANAPMVNGPSRFRSDGATNEDFFDQVHPSASGHARLGEAVAEAIHLAQER